MVALIDCQEATAAIIHLLVPLVLQECSIEMIVGALDLKTVQLLADKLEMKASIELTQYR